MCLRRPWTLAIAFSCSLVVAGFWGANIGAVYPLMEVLIHGQSLPQAVSEDIATSRDELAALDDRLATLKGEFATADPQQRATLQQSLAVTQHEQTEAQRKLTRHQRLESWVSWLPQRAFGTLIAIVIALLVGTLLKNLFLMVNVILVERSVRLATLEIRRDFFASALRLDPGGLGTINTAELTSRFSYDLDTLALALRNVFCRATIEPLKMVACLVLAGMLSWRLLLVTLVLVPVAGYLLERLAKSIKRAHRRGMEEMSRLVAQLGESIEAVQIVKAYTMEQFERARFATRARAFYRKSLRMMFYNALTKPVTEMFGVGVVSMALMAGGYLVLSGQTHLWGVRVLAGPLTPEAFITFFALLAGAADPARKLSDIYALIQPGWPAADRVFDVIDREPTIVDPPQPKPISGSQHALHLENVSFRYGDGPQVLDGINLTIAAGESLAIVGPNGCGKSTLISLLGRFHDPSAGRIRLGDTDLRDLRLVELRQQIGFVSQQAQLFDDTVARNIRYGSLDASDEQIRKAAHHAHAHEFITRDLDEGYDTVVGPGGNRLSGGQRQRIALARAILRDPSILVLGEATSEVDIQSERKIHEALKSFIRGRTTIMITHRLSTLTLADRILVMEAGRVLDIGTHAELIVRCPLYQRLHALELRKSA